MSAIFNFWFFVLLGGSALLLSMFVYLALGGPSARVYSCVTNLVRNRSRRQNR